jgi:hypothetical protein
MTVQSLKTEIENRVKEYISGFASATATNPDPDIPTDQLLKIIETGFLILPQDLSRGALCRVKVASYQTGVQSIGGGPNHLNQINKGVLEVAGISQPVTDPSSAAEQSALMEEIIRLYLGRNIAVNTAITHYSGDLSSYTSAITLDEVEFGLERIAQDSGSPVVSTPAPDVANTSTGVISSSQDPVFDDLVVRTYTIEIVTDNTNPGNLAALTWKWKKDSGDFTPAQPASGLPQALDSNVFIQFSLSGSENFITGDRWQVKASPNLELWVGTFYQAWDLLILSSS